MPNWKDVIEDIQKRQALANLQASQVVDAVRREHLSKLQAHTGRNIIAYYSAFLSKRSVETSISDEDKNGFMMAIHGLQRGLGLDLILHTPGGGLTATHSIVDYLHKMFSKDIRTIVPQIAMSAGTMIACSSKSILMAKHSNLGPIDPQVDGAPAYGVLSEFRKACRDVKRDPSRVPIWQTILRQYQPTFLSQCENAIKLSNQFVAEQLRAVMFAGQRDAKRKAEGIVKKLTDYRGNRTHDRHIHFDECKTMGLEVSLIEDDPTLQDLVLTVHHCYMNTVSNTATLKTIENHNGQGFFKQMQVQARA